MRRRGLEHPRAAAGARVDLVPPPQADEPPAGDVLQVVEVGRQQEDGEDEDEDAVCRGGGSVSGREARRGMVEVGREGGGVLEQGRTSCL